MKNGVIKMVMLFIVITIMFSIVITTKNKVISDKIIILSERASYLNSTQQVKQKVLEPLERMIMDAESDGMCLVVISALRTREQQQRLYNDISKRGYVAVPGTSEHELGIAVDLTACPMKDGVRNDDIQRLELRNDFDTLPEYEWLLKNAQKYNFVQSYTDENSYMTGFPAEAWHWRYDK